MTALENAAAAALEALQERYVGALRDRAIEALEAALAEPEQPVPLNDGRLTQYPDGSIGVGTPAEPEPIEDVVMYGSAWSKDGKRIDPMSVYKEPEQEPMRAISAEQLSKMFQNLEGIDQNQWGYHWRCGWNDALKRAMDYCQAAPTPRKPVELTDEEIDELLPEPDGSAEINPVRVTTEDGWPAVEYEEAPAWSKPLVLATVRAVIAAYEAKNGITGEQT